MMGRAEHRDGLDSLIEFRDVSFSYAAGTQRALDHVSFQVRRGEACALTGPNGCGKSTSLRLLVGLDHPLAGEVRFDGRVVDAHAMRDAGFAKRLHQRIGLVFQDPDVQLFCPTVADEVAFGPRQMGLEPEEVERRLEDCLRLFGLLDLRDRAPWRLSGGERRRCAIACVASLGPDVLCLDEPTNGLDEQSRSQVLGFLRSFVAAAKTVLVATHDEALIEGLGARVVRL